MCVSTSVDTLPKVSGGQEAHEGGYVLGFALYATHPFLEDPVMGQGSLGIMEAPLPSGGGHGSTGSCLMDGPSMDCPRFVKLRFFLKCRYSFFWMPEQVLEVVIATTGSLALGKCGLAAALSTPAGKWCKQSGDQWLEKAAWLLGCWVAHANYLLRFDFLGPPPTLLDTPWPPKRGHV